MERIGSQLVWNFGYIYLPSYLQNSSSSKGYVTFRVKVKPGFAVGAIIPNFAEIYFDVNLPIITNTFLSEFNANLSTIVFSNSNIMRYPNPTSAVLNVNLQGTNESLAKIVIYDVIGKVIQTIPSISGQQTSIDVGALSKGVYMIEITTDANLIQVRKFIVN